MRGRKGREGVACIIGVLLRVGGSGSGSVVANSAKVTERRWRVNNIIGQPFLSVPSRPLLSIPVYSKT